MSGTVANSTLRSSVPANPPLDEMRVGDARREDEVVEGSATEEGIISRVCSFSIISSYIISLLLLLGRFCCVLLKWYISYGRLMLNFLHSKLS
jgi:hypothetical protein